MEMKNKNTIRNNIERYARMMLEKAEHNAEAARNLWEVEAMPEDIMMEIECFSDCIDEYVKTIKLKNIFESVLVDFEKDDDLDDLDLE